MRRRNQKWFSIWLTILMLFSIATPAATAKQSSNLNTAKLASAKERLQQHLAEVQNKKIAKGINTKSNETIKVIVEFNEQPIAVQEQKSKKFKQAFQAAQHKEKLNNERASLKAQLNKKAVNVKFGRSFEKVFNGTVLEIKASDVPKLAEDPNVKKIYENSKQMALPVEPTTKNLPYMADSAPFIGADQLWNLGFEGQGKIIGVIDTGIDYNHPDLKDAYKGGYDFVDNDADPFEGNDGKQHIDSVHGTHVSGIIAGRGTYEAGGTRGIAPKSDLYVYRVLGPQGGWDEWVIAGIEKAVEDGMDVINLSLGNGVNDPDQPTSRAVNNAMLAGVVAVVANGNDGDYGYSTVGSPGTAALAISVGASFPPIKQTVYSGKASATADLGKEYTLQWMMKWDPTPEAIEPLKTEKEMVYMGFGLPADFEGVDLTGKIALVKRGESILSELNKRAYDAGAAGVVVFNADGINEHINHPFPQEGPLPMLDMRGDEGRELIEKMKGQEQNTFTIIGESIDSYPGDELAGFSSKGPIIGSWDIKPDLVAPGVNIRSTIPSTDGTYEKAYERLSGTSMAAPHIAGLAALLLEAHPEMDTFDVKTALMNTSKTIAPLSGEEKYNVQQIGAGRVQAEAALNTPVLAQVQEIASYTKDPLGNTAEVEVQHRTGAINFGTLMTEETGNKTITLNGLTGSDITYKVSYEMNYTHMLGGSEDVPTIASTDEYSAILTPDLQEVTVPANGTADLNVSIYIPTDARNGIYEGYVYLTPVSEQAKPIQLPFIVYNNANLINPISYMNAEPKYLSLNGDGINESTTIEYKYLMDMESAYMYVWNVFTEEEVYGDITELTGDHLKKGIHNVNWDGSFTDWNTGEQRKVPGGVYFIVLEAQDKFGNWHYNDMYFVVANEKTEIKVDNAVTSATGENSVVIRENKLHGMITSDAVFIYRDYNFYIGFPWYWSLISMEYELYDTSNKLLSKGDIDTIKKEDTPQRHVEFNLPENIFPNGESRLVIRVKDKAGNTNEESYQVQYLQNTAVELIGGNDVEVGKSYEITLQANQVKDMVGAEYVVSYPSQALSLSKVVPVAGFPAVTTTFEKVKTFKDEAGTEFTTVKVVTDLRKNPKEHKKPKKDEIPVTGNIQTGKVIFTAIDKIENIGHYQIKAASSSYTNKNLEIKALMGSEKAVEVYTQAGSISGFIKPEALLDENGQLRRDINYGDKEGTHLEVFYTNKGGYSQPELARVGMLDGYRTDIGWGLERDGSLNIYGLNPMEKYDIVIAFPSHFTGIITGIQPVENVNGKLRPANVKVDYGKLIAGDVENYNPYDQKISVIDVVKVARHQGKKAVNGIYESFALSKYDVDKDGKIDEKDLSFPVKNFGLENTAQDGIETAPLPDYPPNEFAPIIKFNTEKTSVKKGDIIPVTVDLANTEQIYALQYGFTYDPSVLQLVGADGTVASGGQLGEIFAGNTIVLANKNGSNRIEFAATHKGDAAAELKDTGTAITYYFKVLNDSVSSTSLTWDRSVTSIFRESYGDVMEEWQKATGNLELVIE
ncbi:S8 family serine peptidase [Bacillus sp. CGMCC 1.16607]|uniref:S8 family serine peptidase n=1 Tax=Bacillus sp. CGMCC 1.16607 TaxID=3351842 RepID=UPI003637C070